MATVKEFYEKFEDVESKLIIMTVSPIFPTKELAEKNLKNLYQLKKELEILKRKPTSKIKGIRIKTVGLVSFESIEKYANNNHIITSEKYLLENGTVFSDEYIKENLEWFIEKGYFPKS